MSHDSDPSPPSDVCLLLRAHAEQRWLSLELSPVLRQLQEPDSLPEEQLGAAMAYLEVLWVEAAQRAAETGEASTLGDLPLDNGGWTLPSKARRYHAAVRTLRVVLGHHVSTLLAIPSDNGAYKQASS